MERSSNSPDASEADPFTDLEDESEVIASKRKRRKAAPKAPLSDDSDDSELSSDQGMRQVVSAIVGLTEKIDESLNRDTTPNVTVEAPVVNLPAPEVTIKTDSPKKWRGKVLSRDEDGRIEEFELEAVE